MSRRLRLASEHLTELTPDELTTFAGGAGLDVTLVCVPSWFHEVEHVVTRAVDDVFYTLTCRC